MSSQVSAIPSSGSTQNVDRPSSAYHPTIWGEHFLTYDFHSKIDDGSSEHQFEELKRQVRTIITNTNTQLSQKLGLIDAIQRLGIDYHFKGEIEDELRKVYGHNDDDQTDLYTCALRFRLLRQHGVRVSCEIFEKFKDNEGNFKKSLTNDVSGILSLYEAAHLGIRGEEILDEALAFATTNLQSILPQLNARLAAQIENALNRPIRKCLPRLEARHFLDTYAKDNSHNKALLKFAKLDFNMLQQLHQSELNGVTAWWKSLEVEKKLPYARDRVVECYFWMMGIYFEPQYSFARIMMAKILAVTSLLDDTYDNFATYQELEILTEAIHRWDIEATDTLPEYMKMTYITLLDMFDQYEENIAKEGKSLYSLHYAKEAMKQVMQAYLEEAKWREEGHIPTMEEYMKVSLVSCCYPMLATISFLGLREVATKDCYEWASKHPKIIRSSAIVCRLMDDIVSHEFEQTRKHVASAVECYMEQYGASEEETIKLFRKEIVTAWKDINEEFLDPTPVPRALLERVLNLTRAMDVIYKDEDGYTNSHILKDYVASVLKDPILL